MSDALTRRRTHLPEARPSSRAPLAAPTSGVQEFLAFRMAHEQFGLPLASVREILVPPPITEVPRAARDILGVISVRGVIITVVDLRLRLGLDARAADKNTRILLVQRDEEVMGLLVDRVLQVFRLGDDELEYAAVVGGDMSEHVLGIGRPKAGKSVRSAAIVEDAEAHDNDILILLNPGPLLRK